ncbi:MAG: preprotein translocase subunit SecG [Chitinophagaceae bacterium]|nr:preprotein translocase subunit SecG [Chitinophagaceae bacterium]
MSILFVILIILASVVLALFVLIQNPKGGGLAGNIAGFSNQLMGVKQTTDVLEKGTWIFAGVIGVLCLISAIFIKGGDGGDGLPNSIDKATGAPAPAGAQPAPANSTPFQVAPTGDSVPK